MKKLFSIIIGLVIGIAASGALILNQQSHVAYGNLNVWDKAVAYGDLFDWNTVFRTNTPSDLYQLIYNNLLVKPQNDALKQVAQKYGLTRDEAEKVIGGSIVPLVNNPNQRNAQLTQEDALILAQNAKKDFEFFLEAYGLQQEIDSSIKANEIFANGDLSDSGFDLIVDLEQIETILFESIEKNLVGQPFGNQLTSPFSPVNTDANNKDYVPGGNPAAILKLDFGSTTSGGVVRNSATKTPTLPEGDATLDLGDGQKIPVEVLADDVCVVDGVSGDESSGETINEALNNFAKRGGLASNPSGGGSGGGGDGPGTKPNFNAKKSNKEVGGPKPNGEIDPAKADEWLSDWCPSLTSSNSNENSAAGNTFGKAGFSSLSGTVNSLINQSAGAGAGINSENFKAIVSICLSTELITTTLNSYQPGQSCVLCELNRINDNMKKTLSHSLVPNKAAGNLMESAKCKSAYDVSLLDMKFVMIASPIPAPSNEGAVFGRNIFEEWKKFVDSYKPFALDKLKIDKLVKRETESAPENLTQADLLSSIDKTLSKSSAEAKAEIEKFQIVNQGLNSVLYGQTVLGQLREMRGSFEGYLALYKKTTEVCNDIGNKKYVK